jgi:transmembrane sensor
MSIKPSNAVLQEAAEWYALLRAGQATPKQTAGWSEWLLMSNEHQTAWEYVEGISRSFTALQDVPNPLTAAQGLLDANERVRHRRRAFAGIGGLLCAGLLGLSTWRRAAGLVSGWAADYHSNIGEQKDIMLADGTRVWLNTATAMNVDYGGAARRIELVAGEVFIETGKDAGRAFAVDSGHGNMRALGTRFNVRRGADHTVLSVYDGAVEVKPHASERRVIVQAGQALRFTRAALGALTAADPAHQSWRRGLLVARDVSLREIVEELGRYRSGHIGVDDDVADLQVYGSFPVLDAERTLAMLATVLPIKVSRMSSWWLNIEARR